ncbi:hypothetical protein JCM8097_002406 [Rhodosporidiobolus ruineniae]
MPTSTPTPAQLARAFLRTTLDDIVPLTAHSIAADGCKVFGASVHRCNDRGELETVTVGTNREAESPLLHGEIQTIQQFYKIPREERPDPASCVFFATHEPCLSGITWSGFKVFYFLFTYEDTRDAFSIPHDIDILQEVFRVPSANPAESASELAARPLYNASNKFFRSSPLAKLIDAVEDEAERDELRAMEGEVRRAYEGLSEGYQREKGKAGVPLA